MKRNFFKAFSVFFIFFILIFSVCVNAGLDNITEKESKNSESLQENAEQNSEGIDEILQNTENTEEQIQNETAEEKITQEENILDIPSENPKLNEENETTIEDINEESSPEYINLEEILNSTKQISEKNNKTIENETQEKEILNESLNDMLPENDVGQLPASSTDSDSNKDANENPKEIKIVNLNPDENAEYIDLDEINGINKENENNSGEYEEEIEEIIPHTSYDSGKKEIEIETYESFDIASIEKIEIEKSELKKEVIVFSEEHIEEELRIYSDLPQEAKKENIKIHWKNEMIELVEDGNYGVEYYDENENGLIDRVSWIVPHLSTQNFEIEIVVETEKKSDSAEIEISVNDAPSGEVEMPINFNFSINYNQEVNCSLWVEIDNYQGILDRESYKGSIDEPKIDYFNFVDEENLLLEDPSPEKINTPYEWIVECWNLTNTPDGIPDYEFIIGDFYFNESFLIKSNEEIWDEYEEKLYFLDLTNNILYGQKNIEINSTEETDLTISFYRDSSSSPLMEESLTNQNGFNLELDESLINQAGEYTLNVTFKKDYMETNLSRKFYVTSAKIYSEAEIKEDEQNYIFVEVNSPTPLDLGYIEFGDGTMEPLIDLSPPINQSFNKIYTSKDEYTIKTTLLFSGTPIYFNVQKQITVINNEDDEPPEINLLYPHWNQLIDNSTIIFEFEAEDNVKIKNCSFKLYEYLLNSNGYYYDEKLIYPQASKDKKYTDFTEIENNENIEIYLKNFEEGEYYWEITCFDNSSNKEVDWNDFTISFSNSTISTTKNTNYAQKDEIEEAGSLIDEFILNEKNLGQNEREIYEILGISDNIKTLQDRLSQIKQYFESGYKSFTSEELKEKREKEYEEEIENILNKIPLDIEIIEHHEYVKNSISSDMEEIVRDYMDHTNTKINNNAIKKIAKANKELQQKISVSAEIYNVKIKYENETQEMILVRKKIDLLDHDFSRILEIIPKGISKDSNEINFLVDNKIINKDPVFEIDYDDLENSEIDYYIKNPSIKTKDFEETETILFEENINEKRGGITGLFVLDFGFGLNPLSLAFIFVLIIAFIFLGLFVFKKAKMQKWKKEPNVIRINDLLSESRKLIKEKEIENARDKYHKIKEIYPLLPQKTKHYFYEKIKALLLAIDKRDIFNLAREYEESRNKLNREDCVRVYADIQKVYERLPKKYKQKIYDRIIKNNLIMHYNNP